MLSERLFNRRFSLTGRDGAGGKCFSYLPQGRHSDKLGSLSGGGVVFDERFVQRLAASFLSIHSQP